MMRRIVIAGNWKMNKGADDAGVFVKAVVPALSGIEDKDIIVFPSSISLDRVYQCIKDTNIKLGAQNMFWEDKGAYTGEISPAMVKGIGCSHVIVGHSERRQYFFERDMDINKKVHAGLKHGLKVIMCIGETLKEREEDMTFDILNRQLSEGLKGIADSQMKDILIAYEPIWAIGTGVTATPAQAEEVHRHIRERLLSIFNDATASSTQILYGGSVKPDNISELLSEPDIDGALIGGASIDAASFIAMGKVFVEK